MEEVRVAEKRLSDYRAIIGGPAFAEILAMASKLKGKRVAHVNATGYGGGGPRRLHNLVPPPRDVRADVLLVALDRSRTVFHAWRLMGKTPPGSRRGPTHGRDGSHLPFHHTKAT